MSFQELTVVMKEMLRRGLLVICVKNRVSRQQIINVYCDYAKFELLLNLTHCLR